MIDNFIEPSAGVNYLQFIMPGMVALSSMTISFGSITFSICSDRLFPRADFPWYSIMLLLAIALVTAGWHQFSLPIKEIKTLSNQ